MFSTKQIKVYLLGVGVFGVLFTFLFMARSTSKPMTQIISTDTEGLHSMRERFETMLHELNAKVDSVLYRTTNSSLSTSHNPAMQTAWSPPAAQTAWKQDVNSLPIAVNGYGSCHQSNRGINSTIYRQSKYRYFTKDFVLTEEPVATMVKSMHQFCDKQGTIFHDKFAVLHNVVMYPDRRNNVGSQSKGGEEVRNVLNQQLNKEDYTFREGFWEMDCSTDKAPPGGTLKWLKKLKLNLVKSVDANANGKSGMDTVSKYTIAIAREDYANLHNWARNMFNTFLAMAQMNIQPSEVSILFLDGHPFTSLDNSWTDVYGEIIRVGRLEKPVFYKNFIWGIPEQDGPITNYKNAKSAYTEEFREFLLQQHNIDPSASLNCKRLTITLIIRRNAVYHPRNIQGNVGRKIFNEAEVIGDLMKAFPGACVQGILMESIPMALQLDIISHTDILIGMHGAGVTHTLFLPQHAAVLELFNKGFKTGRPWYRCYQSISSWRGLKYDSWENFDSSIEMPHDFTILPSSLVVERTKGLFKRLCKE